MTIQNELMRGLLNEPPETLTYQLAMWDNLRLWNIAFQKLRGSFERLDVLEREIENTAAGYANESPEKLRLMKLCRISAQLKIQLPHRASPKALERLGERIERSSVALLRKTDKDFQGTTSNELAAHFVRKTFGELQKKFSTEDRETQDKVVTQILEALKDLPEAERKKLQEELKVDELSERVIRKALLTGALAGGLATVVQTAGFAAYMFATKALAATAGIIGVTLPFGVYVFLTSTIAVLTNPVFLTLTGLGLGAIVTSRANRKIRDGLAPTLAAQAIVQSATAEGSDDATKSFISPYNEYGDRAFKFSAREIGIMDFCFPGLNKAFRRT